MTLRVRTATAEDRDAVHRVRSLGFSQDTAAPPPEQDEDTALPDDRRLVAEADGRVVATLGVWELGQWYGGRSVPCGGVAGVAVDPALRGRGAGGALLREALRLMRDRGEVLSSLFPMTRGVYRRYGWELAGTWPRVQIDAGALAGLPLPDDDVDLAPTTADDLDEMVALYDAVARRENGMLARPPRFSRRVIGPDKHHVGYVARRDGHLVGYLWYQHTSASDEPAAAYRVRVHELIGADAAATLRLWRVVAMTASMSPTIAAVVAPEDVLDTWLPERALRPHPVAWRWMTRLVDPAGAVAARGYPAGVDVEVPLHLTDPVWPDETGSWMLTVSGGQGNLRWAGDVPDDAIHLDVGALASIYTGWAEPRALAGLGRIRGGQRHLDALSTAFHGPTPWLRNFF